MTTAAVGPSAAAPDRAGRLPISTVLTGAFVVTLVRPVSWALGLAGFLAGGGLALMAWPVLVLPSPTGIQNALGGPVSTLMVGTPSTAMLALIWTGIVAGVVLFGAALLAGAWAERNLIAVALEAAGDEGMLAPRDLRGAPGAGSVAILRLCALLPVLAVAIVAWGPLYDAAYHQLVLPDDLATPLGLRVVRDVPGVVVALLATWVVADAAGAIGVRRLVIERRPILVAWAFGWVDLVRNPLRVLATAAFGLVVLALLAIPGVLAAASGWARVRDVMTQSPDPLIAMGTVATWVAIWLGGLALAGVGAAIRAGAWTLEATPVVPDGDATPAFGRRACLTSVSGVTRSTRGASTPCSGEAGCPC